MKVRELIEKLKRFDPELLVYREDTEGTFLLERVIVDEPHPFGPDERHVSLM